MKLSASGSMSAGLTAAKAARQDPELDGPSGPVNDSVPRVLKVLAEFSGLKGQLLVEQIFSKYGSGIMCIPWLNWRAQYQERPCESSSDGILSRSLF